MTGPEAVAALKRWLALSNVSQTAWVDPDDYYAFLTEGRDQVLRQIAMIAPQLLVTRVQMNNAGDGVWQVPGSVGQPLRLLRLRANGTDDLVPSATLDEDIGDYEVVSPTTIRLSTQAQEWVQSIECTVIPEPPAISASTTTNTWGIPAAAQPAAVKMGAVTAGATVGMDLSNLAALVRAELDQLAELYEEWDRRRGRALRSAILSGIAREEV